MTYPADSIGQRAEVQGPELSSKPAAPPEAVVSVLEPPYHERILALWEELQHEFGIVGHFETPVPHFSYHVAASYAAETLISTLETCARTFAPFLAHTDGLGIFTGPQPVLYIAVVRDKALTALHAALHQQLYPIARIPNPYYLPEQWVPHITLTLGPVAPATLGAIVTYLSQRDFYWQIPINNLAVICDNCGVYGLGGLFRLTGNG